MARRYFGVGTGGTPPPAPLGIGVDQTLKKQGSLGDYRAALKSQVGFYLYGIQDWISCFGKREGLGRHFLCLPSVSITRDSRDPLRENR